jgi:hypothetical protein
MSALPPEADMPIVGINVCLVPTADVRSGSVPTRTNFREGSLRSGHNATSSFIL